MPNNVLKGIMILCFGASWPFAIYKSYKTREVGSKSLSFLLLILCGYAAGISYKCQTHADWVLGLYVINVLMVSTEVILYLRNANLTVSRSNKTRFRPTQANSLQK